jgi:glucose uptake protein GlcU
MSTIAINLGILALNLLVFGFTLKLYTEVLKDQSQNRRAAKGTP